MIDNKHLIPQLILDIISDMKKSNASAQLVYLQRLEAIRDHIDHELASFHLKSWRAPAKKEKR